MWVGVWFSEDCEMCWGMLFVMESEKMYLCMGGKELVG